MGVVSLSERIAPQDRFDEFWQLYPAPRRTGKAICKAKWDAITSPTGLRTRALDRSSGTYVPLTLQATPDDIIVGVKRSMERWRGKGDERFGWADDGKFIPMPATWLNQGRWMD